MPAPSSPPAERTLIEAVAAGIAHEVRNPLNALQINLRILEQELREVLHDPSLHVFVVLGKIADELRSLDDFVTEFLRYARPPKLKTEAVRIGTLLSDLATFIAPECAKKGATLSVRAGDGTIQADSFQLKHADSLYRVRVGMYRVVYSIEDARLLALVVRSGHRREVYR